MLVTILENDCDRALQEFDKLAAQFDRDLSELDTRAKLMDPLFIQVLGWNEEDIVRDEYTHKGYLDYLFCIDQLPKFVVEAKKEGQAFEIPISHKGRYYKIGGAISTDNKIRTAIEQTQRYCIDKGVNFGIISNGHQYILFESFKYGSNWREGNCVVFRSLDDIRKNFGLFWDILNKQSVRNGSLRKYVSEKTDRLQYRFRPIDHLRSGNMPITRNNLSPLLQPFIDYVFTDMIQDSQLDVLRRCYVTRRSFEDAGLAINRNFDVLPDFARKYKPIMIIESGESATGFEEVYLESQRFMQEKAPQGSLTLLMGGIGSGKTTFIHHFFNFVLKNPATTVWFYINFLNAPSDPLKIEEYVLIDILRQFEINYSQKLNEKVGLAALGQLKANIKDITLLFSLLIREGHSVSLVLDNVDQHSYYSPEYQERAIAVARYLTDSLKTHTILTLREESFFKSTMSGVLDAFQATVFHISSPRFEDLIRSRINYMLDLLGKDDSEISNILRKPLKLGPQKEIVRMFFEILGNSLRSTRKKGKEILRFIEDTSGGDMRTALRFFNTFLLSGNTDVDEMLTKETQERDSGSTRGYQLPIHHVVKSIILEHSRLYSMTRSRIMNLFEVVTESYSHFLHLRLLNYLYKRLGQQSRQGRGFVAIDDIIEEGEKMGINRLAIGASLQLMAQYGLVEFENQSKEGYERASFTKITNTGIYYLNDLSHDFVYLDLVWMDTPISSKEVVEKLRKHFIELRGKKKEDEIYERFLRTEIFLDYLKDMEDKEYQNHTDYKNSDLTDKEFISEIRQSYEQDKNYIIESRRKRFSDGPVTPLGGTPS